MVQKNPRVSILIPVYKVPEHFLRNCIESCIRQTIKDIEIIVVDDGSPDACGKICEEYAAYDKRIKVIHKKNGGLAAARNTAFENATGDFITFLDGDDYLEDNACELALNCAINHKVEIVLWNQYTEFPNSSCVVKSFGDDEIEFRDEQCKELQARVLDFNGKIAQVFCKLINKKFLLKYNIKHIDELKQGAEGFVFNIALFEYASSAYYIPQPLLHYMYNDKSISHSSNEENYYLILRCFEYIEQYIQNSSNKEVLIKNLYNRLMYVVVTTGITGYFNPSNSSSYKDKVKGYKKFLKEPLIQRALKNADFEGVSKQRIFIIKCVQLKQFWIIFLLAKIRRFQLAKR
ncbi:glycosyltransferase family 2 protein [Enterococcus faecium]|uniref:glycosyltransferase family 2 protein n=1 Tax=Enterococcus faecium TaxID=1352 RepID=UPI000F4F259F|nr:glycosyltransferase family 2 protein [Enterococcus faecium]MCD5099983.1 glycosyltransferase family 2 protein [Enterococcus faecium]ROZ26556.1 glycosyltransferase family 2 protein [Enterococcus faecium]